MDINQMLQQTDAVGAISRELGIDPATEVRDKLNRPLPIAAGKPVTGVMA